MTKVTKSELIDVLEQIPNSKILVIGDIILDRYIWGKVDRISQEAPVPVVAVSRTEDRLGCAGNVVRNLCAIGAEVHLCGFVGDDEEGKTVLDLLSQSGANRDGVVVDRSNPTIVKTRVIAHRQQVVRIDREQIPLGQPRPIDEALGAIIETHIEDSKALILSDYGKGVVSDAVTRRLEGATDAGRLGLAVRPLVVDPHPKNYGNYKKISVAKPNRKEAEIATGIAINNVEDAFRAARVLLDKWVAEMMVISLGEDGLIILRAGGEPGIHLETTAQEVFDVSGAGDTVTALFTSAVAVGASPTIAGVLANIAAGIVVSEIGTVAVDLGRLKTAIGSYVNLEG